MPRQPHRLFVDWTPRQWHDFARDICVGVVSGLFTAALVLHVIKRRG